MIMIMMIVIMTMIMMMVKMMMMIMIMIIGLIYNVVHKPFSSSAEQINLMSQQCDV